MDGVGWPGTVAVLALLVGLAVLLVLHLVALVDALRQPAAAFHGQALGRTGWRVLLLAALLAPGPGSAVALVYLLVQRSARSPGR